MPAWIEQLQRLIQDPQLLEKRQQLRLGYSPQLSYGRHFSPPGIAAKPAAVMVLMQLPNAEADWTQCTIPLTVRPKHLPDHPGQVSFPGGRVESGEDHRQAAIREFEEELGVPFSGSIVASLLPIWVFNSDYALLPILAFDVGPLEYQPSTDEVDRMIHFPVCQLLETQLHKSEISRGLIRWKAKVFRYQDDEIWGATAIVLGELAAILRELKSSEMVQA